MNESFRIQPAIEKLGVAEPGAKAPRPLVEREIETVSGGSNVSLDKRKLKPNRPGVLRSPGYSHTDARYHVRLSGSSNKVEITTAE